MWKCEKVEKSLRRVKIKYISSLVSHKKTGTFIKNKNYRKIQGICSTKIIEN